MVGWGVGSEWWGGEWVGRGSEWEGEGIGVCMCVSE